MLGSVSCQQRGGDSEAKRNADLIRQQTQEMAELAEEEYADPGLPGGYDPCEGISDEMLDEVEEKMKTLNREQVFLVGDEMQALQCLRSEK
jgi:hypothetical protein